VPLWAFLIIIQMAKEIKLTQGKVAIVDNDMYDYLNQFKWHAVKQSGKFYARRHIKSSNPNIKILIHRDVMKPEKGFVIDHIDGNTLNNQKDNLRICTHAQNIRNSKININNTSGFKGVYWNKQSAKWYAFIRFNNKRIHLGVFFKLKDAAKSYNEGALKYHGEFANLNKID
jgi:hypothetical protein